MNIGLIAHDSKKRLMQNFCIAYKGILNKNQLFATGTTGRLIEEVTNLTVHKFLAGHLGGDQQLCAQIEHNQIDLVIFLREAVNPLAHEPDSDNICKLCDMYNIRHRFSYHTYFHIPPGHLLKTAMDIHLIKGTVISF